MIDGENGYPAEEQQGHRLLQLYQIGSCISSNVSSMIIRMGQWISIVGCKGESLMSVKPRYKFPKPMILAISERPGRCGFRSSFT